MTTNKRTFKVTDMLITTNSSSSQVNTDCNISEIDKKDKIKIINYKMIKLIRKNKLTRHTLTSALSKQ